MTKLWNYIKDPVHHYIKIYEEDLTIIDTPLFQRLRNIHHLGTGYLTYPGATHTRFEHSLGVAELGISVLDHIIANSEDTWDIEPKKLENMKKTLRCACLLHDIGHSPFSHTCEQFFQNNCLELVDYLTSRLDFCQHHTLRPKATDVKTKDILREKSISSTHEVMGCFIVLTQYESKLKDMGVNPSEVCALILGEVDKNIDPAYLIHYKILANILNSPIDVDKFDYLLRDNYMTGADLVSLDRERLLSAYTINTGDLVLSSKAVSIAINLIVARQQVAMWIYQHHKVVFTTALLQRIVKKLIECELIDGNYFTVQNIISNLIDDYDLIGIIRANSTNKEIVELYKLFRERKLLKACWKHAIEYDKKITNTVLKKKLNFESAKHAEEFERKICKDLGIDENKILITHTKIVPFSPLGLDLTVEINGIPFSVVSDLGLHFKDIDKYREVPYIFVEDSKKAAVIDYLQRCK
jgi:HD superfamily phosphohydrolase